MAYHVYSVQGDGFMIQQEGENEVLDMVKQHAREKHDLELSDDARDMMGRT